MAKKKAKTTSRIDWLNHLLGFFGVILGVLIAFWLNSAAQERKERQVASIALQNIKAEIERNMAAIDDALDKNKMQLQFFNAYTDLVGNDMRFLGSASQRDSLYAIYPDYMDKKGGVTVNLNLYELPDVAWVTTANTSVVAAIDFELMYTLSETYNIQSRLSDLDKLLLEDLRSFNSGGRQVMLNLQQTLSTSLQLTGQLRHKKYPEALQKIDAFLQANGL